MKTLNESYSNWSVRWCVAVAGLALVATGAAAQDLRPGDALDESKVGISARFVPINVGEFEMSSPSDEEGRDSDEVQHTVRLTRDFEMQATEVTQLQYFLVMSRNPSQFRAQGNCDEGNYQVKFGLGLCVNHPVEKVSWNDAQSFIRELNRIQNTYTYRLPTEAEWEYAARGGMSSGFPYSFGFNDTGLLNQHAWFYGNSDNRTHAIAQKRPNNYGLYDMHGNVWEWVQDYYGAYPTSTVTDPTGPSSGSGRVIRGGGWGNPAQDLRSANRGYVGPDNRHSFVGFRLARTRR